MKFTQEQLEQYHDLGYVIVDCPFPESLTEACMAAVEGAARDPSEGPADGSKRNHFRLRPQVEDSYWCSLDHSLPFLKIILHPEIVELARQLNGESDIYLRNGGINEQAPDRSVGWHIDGGPGWAEFMHYFSGASRQNGCLRIVPGSHNGPPDSLQERAARLRDERGIPGSPADDGWEDIPLEEEISLEVEPHQLIVRHSRLFHATWLNRTKAGRYMSHWLFHPHTIDNHRFTWGDYLTPELLDTLSPEQREVLWLKRDFDIDPAYDRERSRELGRVKWGVV
ncbi:MAG: phytanoyl-CoA dioxygenase family protein [Gemmatimonadaceae bacterium]|nr:phytanoyl-CoA dioxygenase family protein [Gemmatimonadaceae bacterium]